MQFLPTTQKDMLSREWEQADIIIVSGDAYVDHPAWAAALLGRFLESYGFRVGIIAQPKWNSGEDIVKLGAPRLFFAVSAGNMDSMVNHYTADRKKRRRDLYSPGGEAGLRPDRTTIVYCNLIRQHFPGVPVIIGGIEASLRRLAHYDYWSDSIRRSLLLDSKADLLVYGMGEYTLLRLAERCAGGERIEDIKDLRGTCSWVRELPSGAVLLPSFEEVQRDPRALMRATLMVHREVNPYCARPLAEKNGQRWVVQNPPTLPLSSQQLDEIYEMDFARREHPAYKSRGGVPALIPVQFSMVSHRGCFGACSFCSLALHQGSFIQSRSTESLVREARKLIAHPDFKGTISDVGGPSANMYRLKGSDEGKCRACRKSSCLVPRTCPNLNTDHAFNVKMLRRLRDLPGVRHLFVSSGVRYDLAMQDKSGSYLRELCQYHVGGQLKIAPEHIADHVTRLMNKPSLACYRRFTKTFKEIRQGLKKDIYIVPYFISGHPGCRLEDNAALAEFFKEELHFQPEQIQNFTPTPMTLSTAMYVSGLDPQSGQEIHVPREARERRWQRAILQFRDPRNRAHAEEALRACQRFDLISGERSLWGRKKTRTGESFGRQFGTGKKGDNSPRKTKGDAAREGRKKHRR
ncbi:MAG: YgiQ family radical SAM protein [Syntrophomonadaceae bacterium]